MAAPQRPSRLSAFRWLAPAGAAARLQIFIFHRVLPEPDPLLPGEPDAARFDQLVRFIARQFQVLTVSEAARRLADGTLPAAPACITFDDGYADNRSVAAPILQAHGVRATFFVSTGFIDGGRMWNDTVIEAVRRTPAGAIDWSDLGAGRHTIGDAPSRVAAYGQVLRQLKHLPFEQRALRTAEIARRAGLADGSALMMTRRQVVELRELGMEIGAHTVSHPILSRLDEAAARSEIESGRDTLHSWLGEAPTTFAYPNGVPQADYGARDVALVRGAGFRSAVSTSPGAARSGADVYQLPRFTPWDRALPRFALRCALNLRSTVPAAV